MTEKHDPKKRVFPTSKSDAEAAAHVPSSPQTESEAYKLAFQDNQLMLRDELRPVRLQLELMKPELLMQEANIASTFVMYGSARVPEPAKAQEMLDKAKTDWDRKVAERMVAKAHLYDEAYKLAQIASTYPVDANGDRHFVVTSGGGPSFMEAANRGAHEAGKESIGLNIVLPHEQLPNGYITPDLSFQFHYFAIRKMHFLIRARAVAVFPGGFGTFDELFELLTLIQTGKMHHVPVLVFGKKEFWDRVLDLDALAMEGTISKKDLDLITWVETAEEAWAEVCKTYEVCHHP
ncbi:LOG family protein [Sphingomicrobium sediminis]|uniref:AMP nucleosidase n=1 Tax=Sphingomicrobium sediminis TaxID=2950949 RepID=A0A9X2EGQ4_9SPHN|nr:LOG family protein [Sphingomicrobium sediminis]MCM8557713.1 LOG family protein [Sphingomicrobium sediminis]